MDLRSLVYHWAETCRLDAPAVGRLERLAGLGAEPAAVRRHLATALAVLAAALGGLGLVFWVASQWDDLGRAGRFALLQAAVAVATLGAVTARRPALRGAFALLALLATGALLATLGQTYQTGADAWQLFALWAALGVPLALGARSDVVWAPWSSLATLAVSLWLVAQVGARWSVGTAELPWHLAAWLLDLAILAALWGPWKARLGAGAWSLRIAALGSVATVVAGGLGGLFVPQAQWVAWLSALLVLGLIAGGAALPRRHDVMVLSLAALGLNVLLVAVLTRLLLDIKLLDSLGVLLLLGVLAAALLAGTVSAVLRVSRARAGDPA